MIAQYQYIEISRIEATLVDKYSISPGIIIESYAAQFEEKKKEDLTFIEADNWIRSLQEKLDKLVKKAEEKSANRK